MKKRLFSGVQPSGRLHLGNYVGAVRQWIALQEEFEALFCVVDLHAITVSQNPEILREKTLEIAKTYLALGIDPERAHIFIQSQVSEHTELAWILNTLTRMSDLEKMTQFKDKAKSREESSVGLFDYPVLMAADILLYSTDTVPVGEDQTQHLELTRVLARRFNKKFGDTFFVPKTFVIEEGSRIMGLDDPTKKMSKSATSEYNYIALDDDVVMARKKIMRAVTDSDKGITYEDNRPGLKNLLILFTLLSGRTLEDVILEYKDKGCSEFKKDVADIVVDFLETFQEQYQSISDEDVLNILEEGRKYAKKIAKEKICEVKEKMGLYL
ncbi:MAG: tryptophan--tRNA ligase [Candidatus Moraniibacteriota bacterium]|nr:MAG: tryptophan--tRNA ligase [Candidatus Moranbacteria bacterium]